MLQVWKKVKYIHLTGKLHFYGKVNAEKTYISFSQGITLKTVFHEAATIEDKYPDLLFSFTFSYRRILNGAIEAMACGHLMYL
jgi:hypothetical protein